MVYLYIPWGEYIYILIQWGCKPPKNNTVSIALKPLYLLALKAIEKNAKNSVINQGYQNGTNPYFIRD